MAPTFTHIGYLAKPEDPFSTGGNRAFLFYNDGYLYSLPMNADNVWVYAIPELSVTALLIGGGALAFASFRRRVRRG